MSGNFETWQVVDRNDMELRNSPTDLDFQCGRMIDPPSFPNAVSVLNPEREIESVSFRKVSTAELSFGQMKCPKSSITNTATDQDHHPESIRWEDVAKEGSDLNQSLYAFIHWNYHLGCLKLNSKGTRDFASLKLDDEDQLFFPPGVKNIRQKISNQLREQPTQLMKKHWNNLKEIHQTNGKVTKDEAFAGKEFSETYSQVFLSFVNKELATKQTKSFASILKLEGSMRTETLKELQRIHALDPRKGTTCCETAFDLFFPPGVVEAATYFACSCQACKKRFPASGEWNRLVKMDQPIQRNTIEAFLMKFTHFKAFERVALLTAHMNQNFGSLYNDPRFIFWQYDDFENSVATSHVPKHCHVCQMKNQTSLTKKRKRNDREQSLIVQSFHEM